MTLRRLERRDVNLSTPLQIYLHDINDTPLLSAQEERALAERVAIGRSVWHANTWSKPICGWWLISHAAIWAKD